MARKIFISKSSDETLQLGEEIGRSLHGGEVIGLTGELGSGKTTFVKGLALGLDIKRRIVSPTFIIERVYKGRDDLSLYHMDLYRLETVDQNTQMELEEIVNSSKNVVVIEWADKAARILPKNKKVIYFKYIDENIRKITIEIENE